MTEILPAKKDVALALLERSSVYVHLDPRRKGAVVPPSFKKQHQLVLQIGLNMAVAIPDLRFDEEGMSCTLSFSRSPFFCVVPWQAIFAMVGDDGRGMVWPKDVPVEIQQTSNDEAAPSPGRRSPRQAKTDKTDRTDKPRRLVAAPAPAPAETNGKAAPKRRSKKKAADGKEVERPRPQLVAVPRVADEPREQAAAQAERRERAETEDKARASRAPTTIGTNAAKGKAAPDGARIGAGVPRSNKPKRELPPYLRVVK